MEIPDSQHPRAFPGLHDIHLNRPSKNFFEGALIGNGAMGVVVCTRPDGVMFHFGHNNVWDVRIAEKNGETLGTFQEVFDRVEKIPSDLKSLREDPWYQEYLSRVTENYRKSYPRPQPCGTLVLGFDRRLPCEILGHTVFLQNGKVEVRMLVKGEEIRLEGVMDTENDRLWLRTVDSAGRYIPAPFHRVRLTRDPGMGMEFPPISTPQSTRHNAISFRQVLPAGDPDIYDMTKGTPKDRSFRLTLTLAGELAPLETVLWSLDRVEAGPLSKSILPHDQFVAYVQLDEGLASEDTSDWPDIVEPSHSKFEYVMEKSRACWSEYWSRSAVVLDDPYLESVWYRNLYFLRCAIRAGVTCPGLFANWSYKNYGSAWHGDYHMNYNTQQPFWVTFSSNHVEMHEPYVEMVHFILPLSRHHANHYYKLPGAYFPHSAYPVEMSMMPYPSPEWGWEVCETPWTVQSLWWHYLYTQDKEFLRTKAFEPIKDAVIFMVAYMSRPRSHGADWKDDFFHIFPTVSPEMYGGLRPGFDKNADCLVDLTLTKFLFRSFQETCTILDLAGTESELLERIKEILHHMPPYPTAETSRGKVLVDVEGVPAGMVYNFPNQLASVFPGEEHGLHTPLPFRNILENTMRDHRNEGGNHLVAQHLQSARLGLLDLDHFKRELKYCEMKNGTFSLNVFEAGGRYGDDLPFDFMVNMGIWFETFALPVVINECLLQSYTGILRLFPNWSLDRSAEFKTLRAVGAFLVSASCGKGTVHWIRVLSEAGQLLKMFNPWPSAVCRREDGSEVVLYGEMLEIPTKNGEIILLTEAQTES